MAGKQKPFILDSVFYTVKIIKESIKETELSTLEENSLKQQRRDRRTVIGRGGGQTKCTNAHDS